MSSMRCSWLCGISRSFLLLSPAQGQVTYVLLTRSPLIFRRRFVRLACIRHAASVHPEPGSNSLNKCLLQVKINSWLIYPFYCFLRIFRSFVFMILKRTFEECVSLFSYQRSVFALPFVSNSFAIVSRCFLPVKNFFQLF